jgi:hypothetical protein
MERDLVAALLPAVDGLVERPFGDVVGVAAVAHIPDRHEPAGVRGRLR